MIHSHYFIANQAGMPLDEFFTYWRKRHVRAVSGPVPQIRRYLQSHRISGLDGSSIYEGCAESWYDGVEEVLAMRNSPAYQLMLGDERLQHVLGARAPGYLAEVIFRARGDLRARLKIVGRRPSCERHENRHRGIY